MHAHACHARTHVAVGGELDLQAGQALGKLVAGCAGAGGIDQVQLQVACRGGVRGGAFFELDGLVADPRLPGGRYEQGPPLPPRLLPPWDCAAANSPAPAQAAAAHRHRTAPKLRPPGRAGRGQQGPPRGVRHGPSPWQVPSEGLGVDRWACARLPGAPVRARVQEDAWEGWAEPVQAGGVRRLQGGGRDSDKLQPEALNECRMEPRGVEMRRWGLAAAQEGVFPRSVLCCAQQRRDTPDGPLPRVRAATATLGGLCGEFWAAAARRGGLCVRGQSAG